MLRLCSFTMAPRGARSDTELQLLVLRLCRFTMPPRGTKVVRLRHQGSCRRCSWVPLAASASMFTMLESLWPPRNSLDLLVSSNACISKCIFKCMRT
jgi:hypothetical protein